MAAMTGTEIPADPSTEFWDVVLPQRLEDRLTDPFFRFDAVFDFMVIDEAQDLLARSRVWNCLMEFLDGGMEKGSFALFGDFQNQVLTERAVMKDNLKILYESARPTQWHLVENCRNYRIIGDTAVLLAGLSEKVYSAYLRSGGGAHNYDICYFDTDVAQIEQICR
jgi:hypothetical protein